MSDEAEIGRRPWHLDGGRLLDHEGRFLLDLGTLNVKDALLVASAPELSSLLRKTFTLLESVHERAVWSSPRGLDELRLEVNWVLGKLA